LGEDGVWFFTGGIIGTLREGNKIGSFLKGVLCVGICGELKWKTPFSAGSLREVEFGWSRSLLD
jgi:hypothetical protein